MELLEEFNDHHITDLVHHRNSHFCKNGPILFHYLARSNIPLLNRGWSKLPILVEMTIHDLWIDFKVLIVFDFLQRPKLTMGVVRAVTYGGALVGSATTSDIDNEHWIWKPERKAAICIVSPLCWHKPKTLKSLI